MWQPKNRTVPLVVMGLVLLGAARLEAAATTTTVEGTVDDTSATVTVNGITAVVSSDQTFLATGVPLELGANTITAVATDLSGNASDPISIQVDVRPTIVIQGTVVDASPTTVTVNGVDAMVDEGQFTASVPLPLGLNTVIAIAEDASNNTDTDQIDIYVVRPPIAHP